MKTRIASVVLVLGCGMGQPSMAAEEPSEQTSPDAISEGGGALSAALVGDQAAGKKLYRRNCRACHGATAKGASSYPRLVGLSEGYLIDKLERYRAGEVFGPNTPLMAQRVRQLTDQDFADVVAYILSLSDS